MACPPERYANLPIAPKYKQSLVAFCSSPENAAACEQLCQASDEEIIATVNKIAPQLDQWEQEGIPEEIRNASPELANEFAPRSSMTNELEQQGIGALPKQLNPNIPPGQLANVPMPMDVPSSPPQPSGNSYRNGGFVNAPSYGLGGFIKDVFGGSGGGVLGAIIGGAAAFFTGGMSLAAGMALGGAAGAYADTGDLGTAAQAGMAGYGLGVGGGNIAAGVGAGTGGTIAKGAGQIAKVASGGLGQPQQGQSFMPPMPVNNQPSNNGTIQIPGTGKKPISGNPHLNTGLASLPTFDNLKSDDTFVSSTMANLNQSNALSPMEAYYQCVAQNGADNCQLPPEMMDQTNPVNIQPAQYAQNFTGGGAVDGLGTETSDSQPAWLSDNEFVMTADAVRGLGNGNIDAGANKMYNLMAELEQRGRS